MPVEVVTIHRVQVVPTSQPGCISYLVWTHEGEQFFTLDPFRASLCEVAAKLGTPVQVTWKDGRMKTRDIVRVQLDEP